MKKLNPVGKFAEFFIKNYQITIIILIIMIVGGAMGLSSLPREGMPAVEVPYVVISAPYPGATPADVEEKVTTPIENAIKGVENIKSVSSSSNESFSNVVITLNDNNNIGDRVDDIRRYIDDLKPELPSEVDKVNIVQADASGLNMLINVVGPYEHKQLSDNAEILKKELERIKGIQAINIQGQSERKVSILLDQEKLNSKQASYDQIVNSIRTSNISFPGGNFETATDSLPIQIDARFTEKKDIEETKIIGTNFTIKDIAEVKDTYSKPDKQVRTGYVEDGKLVSNESISILIATIDSADLIDVSDEIVATITRVESEMLDKNVKGVLVYDEADQARQQISDLMRSAWQGLIVIAIVLFIFITLRSSLIAAFTIPVSLLFVFLLFSFTSLTLNTVTLFSIILTLGILVDTTIVIVEGMQHNLQKGLSKYDAAVQAVSDFGGALVTATLTTILVFVPIAMMGGVTGEFIKFIPYTVITVLVGSLFISLTITPFLGSKFLKLTGGEKRRLAKNGSAEWKIVTLFIARLRNIVKSKSKMALTLIVTTLLFGLSLYLPISGKVNVDLWPTEKDMEFFQVLIEYPIGTPVEAQNEINKKVGIAIEEVAAENEELGKEISSYAQFSFGFGPNTRSGTLIVKMTNMRERSVTSSDVIEKIIEKTDKIEQAEITATNFNMGPPQSEFPIEIQISGDDLTQIKKVAADVSDNLMTIYEVNEVSDGIEDEKSPQVSIKIDKERLDKTGIPAIQVASMIRSIYQPDKVSELFDVTENKSFDIELEYDIKTEDIDSIKNTMLGGTAYRPIRLSDVADVEKVSELKTISHFDSKRYIEVKASVKEGADIEAVKSNISERFDEERLLGYGLEKDALTFRGEFAEEEQAFGDFGKAFVLAIFLIFMVLVFRFKSFIQPFIIMLAIPLSLIGVFIGLWISGIPISFFGLLGIIALTGIVVNDSIVLIDRINSLRREGIDLREAVVEGARQRTRPILSTSITTIGGILPLSIAVSFWKPLGAALIFGLIASTVLTLVVIPIVYYLSNLLTARLFRKKK